jgi:hypothetical protein
MPVPAFDQWDEARGQLRSRLDEIVAHATSVAKRARVERATNRFVGPLEEFVIPRARALLAELERTNAAPPPQASLLASELELVSAQIESFIGQRQNAALRATLGDADAFAMSCYEPVAEFARAHRLNLTSNLPVTEFGYDMAIWTAFIPTGIAPIWVPRDFFERIAWWPALAHEIAHDFYNATEGLDEGLRDQLGIVPHEVGTHPLAFTAEGLSMHELYRVFGGWFEELFCDVFGTLMCGPAYAWTLIDHFASPHQPSEIARVRTDRTGRRYDEHPPRHLRLVAVAQVLEDIGQYDDAERVRDEWADLHGGDPEGTYFPVSGQLLGVPTEPLASIAAEIAHRLYSEQLTALSGYRLADVPGVDYGPHANQEAERVMRELLAGRAPHKTIARSVVSGAVLAWREAPERESEIIELARSAIAAVGTFEHAPDAYSGDAYARPHDGAYARPHDGAYARPHDGAYARPHDGAYARPHGDAYALGLEDQWQAGEASARDAFILHTILSRPRVLQRMGASVSARGGFLSRRGR